MRKFREWELALIDIATSWSQNHDVIPYPTAWNMSAPPQRTDGHPGWGNFSLGNNSKFMSFQQRFYSDEKAQDIYYDHLNKVFERTNSLTNIQYKNDPTILAWEPINEPQPDLKINTTDRMIQWHHRIFEYIKGKAPRQLTTTGFEAKFGEAIYKQLHHHKSVDFGCAHMWVQNWGHYDMLDKSNGSLEKSINFAKGYLDSIERWSRDLNKPFILEEFGMPRDNWQNFEQERYLVSITVVKRDNTHSLSV